MLISVLDHIYFQEPAASRRERDRAREDRGRLMADQGRGSARGAGGEGGSGGDGSEVELSLRLRTGSGGSSSAAVAATRRSMTIFYNGRVCAVDVTELQARAIITMASQEILTEQQQRIDRDRHQQDSSGSSSSTAAASRPEPPALQRHAAALPASLPRRHEGLEAAAGAVPVTINQAAAAGLSMKRSLQRFLQKRKTRAAAVGSPYAGGRTAQPMRQSSMS